MPKAGANEHDEHHILHHPPVSRSRAVRTPTSAIIPQSPGCNKRLRGWGDSISLVSGQRRKTSRA